MRMWMIDPRTMCRKHLLGEHVETHMCLAIMRQGKSMQGYVDNNLVEPCDLRLRHGMLAAEMANRGYNHKSPMPPDLESVVASLPPVVRFAKVDQAAAREDLHNRCPDCRSRWLTVRLAGHSSEATKKKMSEAQLRRFADPEERERIKQLAAIGKANVLLSK